MRERVEHAVASLLQVAWKRAAWLGSIRSGTAAAARFGRFGEGTIIAFPPTTIYNEHSIWIGSDTKIGPGISLSCGMVPGQELISNPTVRIGDRCLIGRNSGIVAHLSIEIGDDVWTGHNIYVTDQNHGYRDVTQPIGVQFAPEKPVRIGSGSWLGHGVIVLPGATIGEHVVVAAGSVVTGDLPDRCVAAGNPARVIRRHVDGEWVTVP